jgi:hypothetical protein
MTWSDVWKIVLTGIGSVGGIGAIILWIGNWVAKNYSDKIIIGYENRLKTQLDLFKDTVNRYNQNQFDKYCEIWSSLFQLEQAGDDLWQEVNQNNMDKFVENLRSTNDLIGKNSLFIEEAHYSDLQQLMKKFGEYHDGKNKLNLLYSQQNWHNINYPIAIDDWASNNKKTLDAYKKLLDKIRKSFRKQVHFQDNPQTD